MLRTLIPSLEHSEPGRLHTAEFPELKHVITLSEEAQAGCWRFSDIPKPADKQGLEALERISGKLQFDDVINIQFTSGTTGTPKATALTHHNIVNNAYFVGEKMRLNEKDRICLPVPMYHCFAMVMGTLCALMHKASAVFTSAGFDAQAVLEVIETESCTALYGVPTMFISELEHPDFNAYDLTSLRTGIMAGAPCPEELMLRVTNDMHLQDLTIAYGMTETGPVSFQTSPDEDIEHRTQTVGQVLPHVEVKIVDDDGLVVPRGTRGELLTRGYSVMPYYWNDTERTSKAVDEHGWIKSGDIACIDQDGYCSIVGRTKDMLIRGGENIFPREIEEYLYRMPGIQQVEVFGIADKRLGESVCAWIQTEPNTDITAADIIDFCEGKIAHYKIPAHIRFVDSFPMTVTGKVQKFKMKAQMEDELSKIHQSNLKDVRSNIKTADAS